MSRGAHGRGDARTRPVGLVGFIAVGVTLVACGEGPNTPLVDSGAEADGSFEVTPPDIPWLGEGRPPVASPMLTPCPEGWHEVPGRDGEAGTVTCHPYADDGTGGEPGPDDCPDGAAHFVGDPGCTPVGVPCPEGEFPEGLPTDGRVLYVLAGAPAGGDGSPGTPLSTIGEATGMAWAGTVIAIGKGVYDEALRPRAGVTLWGACAAETRVMVSSPGPFDDAIITIDGADAHLKHLRLGPGDLVGLGVFGPTASVSVEGLLIEDTQGFGVFVGEAARMHGRELVVSGTRGDRDGRFGRGIEAQFGSVVELARVEVSSNRDVGIYVDGEETRVTLSDLTVRGTRGRQSDRGAGRGLGVQLGATAIVSRALFSENREVGVFVGGAGASATLSDVVVQGTQGQESDGTGGRGLGVQLGGTAHVSRAQLTRNREMGVFATNEGTSVTLSDVVVSNTQGQESNGTAGRGLNVQFGARAEVTRALLAQNQELGVFAAGEGSSITMTDVVVRDTRGRESDGGGGRGLNAERGATIEVTRGFLSENRDVGVVASGTGTSVTLSDVVVAHTRGRHSDGATGRGLNVQGGAAATVTRAVLSHNRGFGVVAMGHGTDVDLSDIVVTQTNEQSCATTTCTDHPYGVGLAAATGASLAATLFAVRDSALCGVLLAENGTIDLSVGTVSRSPIGVCLQVDGYPVSRLTDRVSYLDNGTNLDSTSLPVPQPGETAQSLD